MLERWRKGGEGGRRNLAAAPVLSLGIPRAAVREVEMLGRRLEIEWRTGEPVSRRGIYTVSESEYSKR